MAACKAWLPLPVWNESKGVAADAPNCYFSDLYKAVGRQVDGYAMAAYTSAIFCPGAPIDPMLPVREDIDAADIEASRASLAGQVRRHTHSVQ